MNKTTIKALDGSTFDVWIFCHAKPKATIQILHGMAEHCLRYQALAEMLQNEGYRVIMHNHRGHGERRPVGHYADSRAGAPGGWDLLLDDVLRAQDALCGSEPRILLGHSMGSFIAQAWAMRYGEKLAALILSGSNSQPAFMLNAGLTLAKLMKAVRGGRHPSRTMDTLSFGSFNRAFRPPRTDFDWLSRDHQQVDAYIADPQCGHLCTLQMWCDMLTGIKSISGTENLKIIPTQLPLYIFGGDHDPVGRMGAGLKTLSQQYQLSGHNQVTLKLYPEGRHEMLNETNREEVCTDLLNWLNTLFENNTTEPYEHHHQPHI